MLLLWIIYVISVLFYYAFTHVYLLMPWSDLLGRLSFVSNCDRVTFPLVSWVRCGAWLYRFLIFAFFLLLLVALNHWGPQGVCAPLIHENNALISPYPWKKIPQLPESIFALFPKIFNFNSASPQIPQNMGQFSLKSIFLSIELNSHEAIYERMT